jgi:eukaryotic-like serine/threonine-protein kinase
MKFLDKIGINKINQEVIKTLLLSATFIKQLALSVLIGLIVLRLTFFILDIYTRHGDSLEVPDFTRKSLKDAAKLAKNDNLKIVVIDSVFNFRFSDGTIAKPGTIVEHTPSAGFKVKENRTIFVTLKTYQKEMIKIPNFIEDRSKSLIQVKADLEAYGLTIGKLIFVGSEYKDLVLAIKYKEKDVKPGMLMPKGSPVDLVVGMGESMVTFVPDLLGESVKGAKEKLFRAYLNFGSVKYDNTVKTIKDTLIARIWKQEPPASNSNAALLGESVNVWLTKSETKVEFNEIATKGIKKKVK